MREKISVLRRTACGVSTASWKTFSRPRSALWFWKSTTNIYKSTVTRRMRLAMEHWQPNTTPFNFDRPIRSPLCVERRNPLMLTTRWHGLPWRSNNIYCRHLGWVVLLSIIYYYIVLWCIKHILHNFKVYYIMYDILSLKYFAWKLCLRPWVLRWIVFITATCDNIFKCAGEGSSWNCQKQFHKYIYL